MQAAESLKTRKQKYLKECIIDSGYSPDDFLNFSLRVKPDAADIANWSEDELHRIVSAFREQPDVFFTHNKSWRMKYMFDRVTFSHVGRDKFMLQVQEAPNSVFRTLRDVAWTFQVAQAEHRHLSLLRFPDLALCQRTPDEVLSDAETKLIQYYIEFLYLFFYMKDFHVVRAFFTLPEDQFGAFRTAYRPRDGPFEATLSSFTPQFVLKRLSGDFQAALDFDIAPGLPEAPTYPKYMSKFLEKSMASWARVNKHLQEIDGLFAQVSNAYRGLAEAMLDLYASCEKLETVIKRKDPQNKQLFLCSHRIFTQERPLTRKVLRRASANHRRRPPRVLRAL